MGIKAATVTADCSRRRSQAGLSSKRMGRGRSLRRWRSRARACGAPGLARRGVASFRRQNGNVEDGALEARDLPCRLGLATGEVNRIKRAARKQPTGIAALAVRGNVEGNRAVEPDAQLAN